jgi:hypothetical protein
MMTRPMMIPMTRTILACALLVLAASAARAQSANPYEGTSAPPADDSIATPAKPSASHPVEASQASAPVPAQLPADASDNSALQPQSVPPAESQAQPVPPEEPRLNSRRYAADPDGDIVHPRPLRPNELPEGATIHVELLDRLSTISAERGQPFRSRVTRDVLQAGQVLIPAGTEIDGRVAEASSGHPGGRGSMRLRPETIILADGTRYHLRAEVSATPGAKSKVGSEGTILPDSRLKRDGIEYGGAVGAGATNGAVMGGPVGALTGGLIGAGVVTAHLLVSHPQATLETGTALVFTLSEPLQLAPVSANGN